ncbi:MAG: hypothetical protein ACKO23_12670, partial [Gemmataceae bacterium]
MIAPDRRTWLASSIALLAGSCGWTRDGSRVVLYCAQDREFATGLFADFAERHPEYTLAPRFDTEANKSVGFVQLLLQEKNRPRCDVFWNNEIIGTLRLQKAGFL